MRILIERDFDFDSLKVWQQAILAISIVIFVISIPTAIIMTSVSLFYHVIYWTLALTTWDSVIIILVGHIGLSFLMLVFGLWIWDSE